MVPKVVWLFLFSTSTGILILDKFPTSCNYKNMKDNFTSKEWRIMDTNTEVIFNLCEFLPEEICGARKRACVKKHGKMILEGKEFVPGEDGNLLLVNKKSKCRLTILPECLENMQETSLREISSCEYEVRLMSPTCEPPCTTRFNGHLIDLRPLGGKRFVQAAKLNFSIDICNTNPDCGTPEASSCVITNRNRTIPLSSTNEVFKYDEEAYQIEKHGVFKGTIPGIGKKTTRFELIIKCDWNTKYSEINYKEVQIQGKNYKFEMRSSYACIKEPPKCIVPDKFHVYNLTSLHRNTNWKVRNSEIILNICGPLQPLPPFDRENDCLKSFSQVCEIKGKKYTNMGSIQTELIVENDIIKATFISGSTCGNDSYSTYIEFKCSRTEEYPSLISTNDSCRTVLNWNTPAACPINNKESCQTILPVNSSTTFETPSNIFNLSNLFRENGKHTVKVGEIEYMLNIGGPVIDDDAPCKKNMMVAIKNLTEYDVRRRVKSLGQMDYYYENDRGQLVIQTSGGDFSTEFRNYYKSTIIFECDAENSEEDIKLLNKTDITFEFLWKTSSACPIPRPGCRFKYPFDDHYLFDFTTLKNTDLTLNLSGSTYLFDICRHNESKCDEKDCIYVPVEKSLVSYGNKTHLEFTLNRTCIDNNQFNKALFELVCDKIENNDHYEFKGLENCTLLFHLKTHQACAQENLIVSLYKDKMNNDPGYSIETFPSKHTVDEEKDKQKMNNDPGYSIETFPSKHTVEKEKENSIRAKTLDVVHEQKTEGEKDRKDSIAHNSVKQNNLENCSVVNHQTGFRFSISSLNLNVSSPACPQIFFNDSDKSVALMFSLVKPCENSKTFKYTVIMECPPEDILQNTTKKGKCLEIFTIQLPEACKLFEKSFPDNRFTSGKIAGITIGTVGAILFLIGVSILTFLKCRGSKKRNSYDSIAYEKDADL